MNIRPNALMTGHARLCQQAVEPSVEDSGVSFSFVDRHVVSMNSRVAIFYCKTSSSTGVTSTTTTNNNNHLQKQYFFFIDATTERRYPYLEYKTGENDNPSAE
jgi:hypothetical protein